MDVINESLTKSLSRTSNIYYDWGWSVTGFEKCRKRRFFELWTQFLLNSELGDKNKLYHRLQQVKIY